MLGGVQGSRPSGRDHRGVVEHGEVDHVPEGPGLEPGGGQVEFGDGQGLAGGQRTALVAHHLLGHLHHTQVQLGAAHGAALLVVDDAYVSSGTRLGQLVAAGR